jgi:transcription elongation factor Elf1
MQKIFEKSEEVMWECRICGHLVVGKKAPAVCPVCKYSQRYFEVRKENYWQTSRVYRKWLYCFCDLRILARNIRIRKKRRDVWGVGKIS